MHQSLQTYTIKTYILLACWYPNRTPEMTQMCYRLVTPLLHRAKLFQACHKCVTHIFYKAKFFQACPKCVTNVFNKVEERQLMKSQLSFLRLVLQICFKCVTTVLYKGQEKTTLKMLAVHSCLFIYMFYKHVPSL